MVVAATKPLALRVLLAVALQLDTAHAQNSRALNIHSDAEVSAYADSDAVTVLTPALAASVEDPVAGVSASGGYLLDIVSAASVDIVSTASPNWQEVRQAANVSAQYKPGDFGVRGSAALSSEPDYRSVSGGLHANLDLADKNLNISGGYAYGRDRAGRTGTPFSVYSLGLQRHAVDVSLALVLDRATLFTVTGDAVFEVGRQEKPYRFLPLFEAGVAAQIPRGASVDFVNRARLPGRSSEHVPGTRQRFALSGRLSHRARASTLLLSERLYADSWALLASTVDVRWVFDVSRRLFLWPHLRSHLQSGASFWQRAYSAEFGDGFYELPQYRTGNRELSPLWSQTVGAGGRYEFGGTDPETWAVTLQLEGSYTSFRDALYIRDRWAAFGALGLDLRFR